MGSWFWLGFSKTLKDAREMYREMRSKGFWADVELWKIEEDIYGNRYVFIGRGRQRGRNPKLKLIRQIPLEK